MSSHRLQLMPYKKRNPSRFPNSLCLEDIHARPASWADQGSQVVWPDTWPLTPVKHGILSPDVQCESACLVLLHTDRRGSLKGRVRKKQDVIGMTLSIQQTGIQDKGISARNMTNQKWLLKGTETEAKWVICFLKNTQNMPVREHKLSKWLCATGSLHIKIINRWHSGKLWHLPNI